MKNKLLNLFCLLLGAGVGIGAYLLFAAQPWRRAEPELPAVTVSEDAPSREALWTLSSAICECLARGDYAALSAYVHPTYGLVFSPHSTINLSANQCFTPNRVAIMGEDATVYTWGLEYGSDAPIQLTPREYLSRFVYDRDYLHAPLLSFNTPARSGNALENLREKFPEARFVDLCCDPEGADWRILRLVFEQDATGWKLSALVHSAYTE